MTLVELMITIMLAGIVIGLAVPAFDGIIQRSRSTSEFNRFLGDMVFARSEAVKRSQVITMCPTTNQTACSGTDWDGGWLVRVGAAGDILRVGMPTKGNVEIAASGFATNGLISFGSDGKLEDGVAADIGRFIFCDDAGASAAKGLTFSPFGQHRQMRDTNDDDIVDYEDSGTQNVSC